MKRLSLYAAWLLLTAPAFGADFTVITTNNSGPGSLHQAILDANALSGPDRIVFNIPGSGRHLIDVSADFLPPITDALTIDGYTQPGAQPNTLAEGDNAVILIQIDGGLAAPMNSSPAGLTIQADDCVVRGLMITRFKPYTFGLGGGGHLGGFGITSNSDRTVIEGNFIGTDLSSASLGNLEAGIRVSGAAFVIGGITPAQRNLIGANTAGIWASGSTGGRIIGNQIGSDGAGSPGAGNDAGIILSGSFTDTVIGGTTASSGNLIAGNLKGIRTAYTNPGTQQTEVAQGVIIQGNIIGSVTGNSSNQIGLELLGTDHLVGGLASGAGNRVVNNGAGIVVPSSISERITMLSNLVYANAAPAQIDLGGDGPTSNDLGDPDPGANHLQNFPTVTTVTNSNGNTVITVALNSIPSTAFVVQMFGNLQGNTVPTLLDTRTVNTDANGNASFQIVYPGSVDADTIAGTATDPDGNTSELTPLNGPVQLANLSTRAFVETGDNILIAGFVISGNNPKKVAIRALGPSLSTPSHLSDAKVELRDSSGTLLAKNDDWKAGQQQEVMNAGLAPSSDLESALITTLDPGSYTALVRGGDNDTGNGVVEIYDLDSFPASTSRLVNLSTRAPVHTGDDVLIAGMIIRGDAAENVVIRAIGPDLVNSGVPNPLPDPTLEVRDASGAVIASNDNWRDFNGNPIPTILQPKDDRDSAVAINLPPGSCTAIVRGKGSDTGVALVEIYDLKN